MSYQWKLFLEAKEEQHPHSGGACHHSSIDHTLLFRFLVPALLFLLFPISPSPSPSSSSSSSSSLPSLWLPPPSLPPSSPSSLLLLL
mmetsp:Transcript_10924/g.12040  ORF Transcript_10924/g.12040 Transcript_10924/m.12040 type:complete len:87 (+) Transcript_10924:116-376(+)